MNKLTNSISAFFNEDFKKRFLIFISIPFLLCTSYLIDYIILPEFKTNEKITSVKAIYIQQSVGGTSTRESKKRGYKYTTISNYKFSTLKRKIDNSNVQITISPIFKTVKTVKTEKRIYKIQSGLDGVNGLLIIGGFFSMFLSICYTILKKTISDNSRLNLIFLNIFLITIWFYSFIKFVL